MKQEIPKDLDVHSEDMQNIIEKPPRWIEQRGNSVVFLVLAVIMLFTMLIEYPDIIRTKLIIQSKELAKIVDSPFDGFVYKMSVTNKMQIKKGDVLMYISKEGEDPMLLKLHKTLNELRYANQDSVKRIVLNKLYKIDPAMLGDIEPHFLIFQNYLFKTDSSHNNFLASDRKGKINLSIDTLLNMIEEQKRKYIIRSPSSGTLEISGDLVTGKTVRNKQTLIQIIPNKDSFYGEMNIPQNNMGKVSVGQFVRINLESYPYLEYGYINGKIISIDFTPDSSGNYPSKIELDRSTANSLIQFKPGMRGQADIILQEQSAFKRIWLNTLRFLK